MENLTRTEDFNYKIKKRNTINIILEDLVITEQTTIEEFGKNIPQRNKKQANHSRLHPG